MKTLVSRTETASCGTSKHLVDNIKPKNKIKTNIE